MDSDSPLSEAVPTDDEIQLTLGLADADPDLEDEEE